MVGGCAPCALKRVRVRACVNMPREMPQIPMVCVFVSVRSCVRACACMFVLAHICCLFFPHVHVHTHVHKHTHQPLTLMLTHTEFSHDAPHIHTLKHAQIMCTGPEATNGYGYAGLRSPARLRNGTATAADVRPYGVCMYVRVRAFVASCQRG